MDLRPIPPRDYRDETKPLAPRGVRWVLLVVGLLCVGLGAIGVVTPVLPTTPFLLVAAACYARASRRFYNALLNSRLFGPAILEWHEHRAIAWRTKLTAIALMSLTLAASIIFFVENPWLRLALALFGVALAAWLYRIPSRDAPDTHSPD